MISIIINISFQLLLRVSELTLTRCQNGYGTAKLSLVLIKHNAMKTGGGVCIILKILPDYTMDMINAKKREKMNEERQ